MDWPKSPALATATQLEKLTAIDGVTQVFQAPFFHEILIQTPVASDALLEELAQHRIVGGFDASKAFPELENSLLVCATETKTSQDIDLFVTAVKNAIDKLKG